MNTQEIIDLLQELDAKKVKFAVTDIDGVLRGKILSTKKFLKALEEQIGFCNVIFGWDVNDQCYDNTEVIGWHTGYPDELATIDPETYRKIPWEFDTPFFLGDFSNSKALSEICPRSLLKHVRNRALEMGFIPKFSAEFEWFNFQETPTTFHQKEHTNPTPLSPGMFGYSILRASQNSEYVHALWESLADLDIPLEGIHTETGSGVYEAAIEYDDILISADRAALFKTSVKEVAAQFEIMPSFMAKWNEELPGCSGHLHQSLWTTEGENIFFDASQDDRMSSVMESYLAGLLHCLPSLLPIFAPTTNSYRRFVEGSWAPTSTAWGIENRTTAYRVINGSESAIRIENRVPGADANPYLTMAASLAAGLYGIEQNLSLEQEATKGNQYEQEEVTLFPKTLNEAIEGMKESELPSQLLGSSFVDHFVKTREWEWKQFRPDVPNWEMKRYFEII